MTHITTGSASSESRDYFGRACSEAMLRQQLIHARERTTERFSWCEVADDDVTEIKVRDHETKDERSFGSREGWRNPVYRWMETQMGKKAKVAA